MPITPEDVSKLFIDTIKAHDGERGFRCGTLSCDVCPISCTKSTRLVAGGLCTLFGYARDAFEMNSEQETEESKGTTTKQLYNMFLTTVGMFKNSEFICSSRCDSCVLGERIYSDRICDILDRVP